MEGMGTRSFLLLNFCSGVSIRGGICVRNSEEGGSLLSDTLTSFGKLTSPFPERQTSVNVCHREQGLPWEIVQIAKDIWEMSGGEGFFEW